MGLNLMAMKKVLNILLSAVICMFALSCEKEINNNDVKDYKTATITLGLSPQTLATFDENGIKWSAGDVIRFTNEGFGDAVDIELTAGDISVDGHTATITASFPNVSTAVFRHNFSPRNNTEWDFGYMGNYCGDGSSFTEWNKLVVKQSEAGQMNRHFLFLHSGLNKLAFDYSNPPTTVAMEILGTILRIIPYTDTYNDEAVQSVTLSTGSSYGLGGCTPVTYSTGAYRDQQDVNWGPDRFNTYEVDLTTEFSLAGVTSAEASKAIYFSLPATNPGHSIAGYTIKVATDKAVYTFDGSAKSLTFGQNKVRNMYLDLDKATTRVANDDMYGIYWFDGNLGNHEYPAAETTVDDLGYWVAYYQNTLLGDDTVRAGEPTDYPSFYSGLTISAVDDATGLEPTWLTYGYSNLSVNSHWALHLDANTAMSPRSATVTIAPAASVAHYNLRDGTVSKTFTITQLANVTIDPIISNLSSTTVDAAGGVITATISLELNGVAATPEQFNTYISQVNLSASSGTLTRAGSTLTLTIGENPTTSPRVITITASADSDASVDITQAASASAKVYSFTYSLASAWNTSSCNPRQLYFNNTADSGRTDWVIIITDLAESGSAYTAGAAFDPYAVEPLLKKVLGLSDSDYTTMSAWLHLDIEVLGAQWIIVVRGFEANTTGVARSISGPFYNDDGSAYDGSYTIQQNA